MTADSNLGGRAGALQLYYLTPLLRCLALCTLFSLFSCQGNKTNATAVPPAANSTLPNATPSASPAPKTEPQASDKPEVLFLDPSSEERQRQVVKQRCVVAAIGDSLTDPKGPSGGKYLKELEKRLKGSKFYNFGRGGNMVNQMRRRFEQDVFHPSHPPYTHIIVFGGVNDLYSDKTAGRTNDLIQKDLSAMYQMARSRGAQVVAVTVAPWGGFTRYFNPRRGENTRSLNRWIMEQTLSSVEFAVDIHPLLRCGENLCPRYALPHKDGIHMGPEGHTILADALQQVAFSHCL